MPVHEISASDRPRDAMGRGDGGTGLAVAARPRRADGDDTPPSIGDRRRHKRIAGSGLHVAIGSGDYAVRDLSVGGFSIESYSGPLQPGETFPLRLMFEHRGETEVIVEVAGPGAMMAPMSLTQLQPTN